MTKTVILIPDKKNSKTPCLLIGLNIFFSAIIVMQSNLSPIPFFIDQHKNCERFLLNVRCTLNAILTSGRSGIALEQTALMVASCLIFI